MRFQKSDTLRAHGETAAGLFAFTFPDLLVVVAISLVLAAMILPLLARSNARSKQVWCITNLKEVNRAVLMYADENKGILPSFGPNPRQAIQFYYKELVKGYIGMTGKSSKQDKKFACPNDRGFTDPKPFRFSERFDFNSYVFNGVTLPDAPNLPTLAGKQVSSVKNPMRTLLTMEWPAHAPLSWHNSRTGRLNYPFYNDAENVVGFVDGHVKSIKIYYDGMNAAYTRDPIPGYEYQYSPD